MIARVDPRLPDMILASSGEEDFFVKKSRKAAFEPKNACQIHLRHACWALWSR